MSRSRRPNSKCKHYLETFVDEDEGCSGEALHHDGEGWRTTCYMAKWNLSLHTWINTQQKLSIMGKLPCLASTVPTSS